VTRPAVRRSLFGTFATIGVASCADHPDEANDLRAIQQPLVDYKNNCGMQVSPTDALTVLAEV
jgi:Haemophore, haem-binding